jgi:hypothetical protein
LREKVADRPDEGVTSRSASGASLLMGLPTSESHIAAAERDGHFTLPAQWKLMLLRSNGLTVQANGDDWEAFPVLDGSSRKHLARSANHILRETESFRSFPRFPSEAVAIASNGSGDCLVLFPAQSNVYVWDHETGELEIADVSYPKADFKELNA